MKKYLFIVAFLMGAQKLAAQLVIGDNPKQPKAPGKSLLELNNKETNGNGNDIPGGLLLPQRKKSSASTDTMGFSEGALVYNDSGYFEILTIKNPGGTSDEDKKLEWKKIASGANAIRPELINVTKQVTSINGSSGSNVCVQVCLPSGYVPYVRANSSSSTDGNTNGKQVVVSISYNGFALKQQFNGTSSSSSGTNGNGDFTAVYENGSDSNKKIKITFLTLQPEQYGDFDRILVQAVRS